MGRQKRGFLDWCDRDSQAKMSKQNTTSGEIEERYLGHSRINTLFHIFTRARTHSPMRPSTYAHRSDLVTQSIGPFPSPTCAAGPRRRGRGGGR